VHVRGLESSESGDEREPEPSVHWALHPPSEAPMTAQTREPGAFPHVLIVGAGFAGLGCAKELAKHDVRVTLLDKHNYHQFQPLLYQVATSQLAPSDIAF